MKSPKRNPAPLPWRPLKVSQVARPKGVSRSNSPNGGGKGLDKRKEALRSILDYRETLIENANDIIYTLDPSGHFTFCNGRALEIIGASTESWRGIHFLNIVARQDRASVAARFRTLHWDKPQSFDIRLGCASCSEVEVSVHTTPIFKDGQWVGTLGIARDMTDQNRLEQTIREERDRLDAILKSMAEGVLVTDAQYRLILLNRVAEELIGLPRAELIGRDLDSIALPISQADVERQLSAPGLPSGIQANIRPWGTRMLDIMVTPLYDLRGHLAGTVSLLRDVTGLVDLDRMKNEFISLVSHELRTPLTSIKGYTDLILAGDAGTITSEQQEFLGIVKTNADHLIMMINELLDISRVEAGRLKLSPSPVPLSPLIGDIIRSLRPQLEGKKQKVYPELAKSETCVLVDPDRISQILWNLLSNACKYSPPGACIRIYVQPVQADRHTAGDPRLIEQGVPLLAVSVQDEGVGIAPEDQERLFTKFYRVNNSMTREIGGTGLGLAIVRSFVELHGGRVWVESPLDHKTGRGSRFTFTVPLAPET